MTQEYKNSMLKNNRFIITAVMHKLLTFDRLIMHVSQLQLEQFKHHIWEFYHQQGRTFAWRLSNRPYEITVSEIMLQQTQTHRVVPKYDHFITAFPTWQELAQASTRDVLILWQGLGYNRRALALHKTANIITKDYAGILPNNPEILITFPGIGAATAASICAFAFNQPTVFIETNIRTVFIHSFFKDQTEISDKQLLPLIAATVDPDNPRAWYYALMDYGVMLKKQYPNPSRKSKHHTMQSKFQGSDRQIRGAILRFLTQYPIITHEELIIMLNKDMTRSAEIIEKLQKEGFIKYTASGELTLS